MKLQHDSGKHSIAGFINNLREFPVYLSLGKKHLNKLKEVNQAATASEIQSEIGSASSNNSLDSLTKEDKEKQALFNTLNAFIDSFDPIPKPCAVLRLKKVLTSSEYERIQSQVNK